MPRTPILRSGTAIYRLFARQAMSTAQMSRPPQTLYVSIRRDELRQLKDERDQLQQEVLRLRSHLQGQLEQTSAARPALC